MDKILYKNILLGIRIKKIRDGVEAVTSEDEPLQVLTHKHQKGARVLPHRHTPTKRSTQKLEECLVVLKGKVRVDLYGDGTKVLKRVTVRAGEAFVTISGGHSVIFQEDSEVIETKNGPFKKDRVNLA